MISFLKRLFKNKRGNALLIAGAALPVAIGVAGLASDTVQWTLWKRQLQRAADSAAIAGASAYSMGDSVSTGVSTDLTNDNGMKNQSGISLNSGYPQISNPTVGSYSYAVKVDLAAQKSLSFSSLFMSTAPTITASATAALVDQGDYCVVALEPTTATGITIQGSSTTNLGCGAISNSRSSSSSVSAGGSYTFTSTVVAGVGGLPSSITGVSTLRPHHTAEPDPFANKYPTSVPSDCNTGSLNQGSYTTTQGNGKNKVTVNHLYSYETNKVCYNNFKFTGQTYYLDAGTYYLNSADFDTTGGATLIGSGVTIILTGSSPGSIKMNGNATIQLSAPTSGTYQSMLFIQSSSASANNGNTINGNSSSSFDGAIYLPNGQAQFTGSTGATTKCAMVVARQVQFSGNANLQNNTTGCTANETVKGKEIKLVA